MKILYTLITFLALGILLSWYIAGKLVTAVPMEFTPTSTTLPLVAIELQSRSGAVISGWHVRHPNSKGVVLLFHGIRGNRMSMLGRAQMLYEHSYSSVLIDFQAHGRSTGKQITIGHLERFDVLASLEFAREHHPSRPIGLIGVSMGGAAALLASPLEIDAMVIESVYPNIKIAVNNRVKKRLGPLYWLPAQLLLLQLEPRLGVQLSDLRPIDKIQHVDSPLFVISGKEDKHTTAAETIDMYTQAKAPKDLWLVDHLEHDDALEKHPEDYKKKVLDFLNTHMMPIDR